MQKQSNRKRKLVDNEKNTRSKQEKYKKKEEKRGSENWNEKGRW